MYLPELEFSLWADFIEREFIETGLKELIDKKIVNGATSNPAIFKQAILTSAAYARQLETLKDHTPKAKYEALAVYDIQKAADVLAPLFAAGDDGFVSIEVDPFLCDDTTATIEEGKRLFATIGRPNVMIKVPATEAGFEAMEALCAAEIPVNATLIFSEAQAKACTQAFAKGSARAGHAVPTVISVFVSRFDRKLDEQLAAHGIQPALVGIYNAARVYDVVKNGDVASCRTLFASTGVKGDNLRPSYYIDELLAPQSVNTAPIKTIEAFVDAGHTQAQLPIDAARLDAYFTRVAETGIDLEAVQQSLMTEGLEAFKAAFADILSELE